MSQHSTDADEQDFTVWAKYNAKEIIYTLLFTETSDESCHTLKLRFPSVSGLSGLTQELVYRKKKIPV